MNRINLIAKDDTTKLSDLSEENARASGEVIKVYERNPLTSFCLCNHSALAQTKMYIVYRNVSAERALLAIIVIAQTTSKINFR